MPYEFNGGWNPQTTQLKQQHVQYVLGAHLNIVERILGRHAWACPEYLYLDLTAGPGVYADLGAVGSPVIFHRLACAKTFPSRAVCFENDPATKVALEEWLAAEPRALHVAQQVIGEDHLTALPTVLTALRARARERYGLVYADPNGSRLPVGALQLVTAQFPRLDVLLYVSATAYKRVRGAGLHDWSLQADLEAINKRVWFVRQPHGAHQWSLFLGTNWPDMKAMKQAEMHPLDSPAGQAVFDRLTYTAKELQQREAQGEASRYA